MLPRGAEVFLPDAVAIGRRKVALCADHGFDGLFPLDDALDTDPSDLDGRIYRANRRLIDRADMAILNLTPFRGTAADAGTVFELGLFVGLGKPVFAYTNDATDLIARVRRDRPLIYDEAAKAWIDVHGMMVEDFGNADNLMIDCALREQGRVPRRIASADPLRDMTGFIACLEDAGASLVS